jgi:hypothetical protein
MGTAYLTIVVRRWDAASGASVRSALAPVSAGGRVFRIPEAPANWVFGKKRLQERFDSGGHITDLPGPLCGAGASALTGHHVGQGFSPADGRLLRVSFRGRSTVQRPLKPRIEVRIPAAKPISCGACCST